jgi:hypothetical protein
MTDMHLVVVNYGRQVVRRKRIRFQHKIRWKRGMRISKDTEDGIGG